MNDWSIARARRTYNIANWGSGYFDINEQGHLAVLPDRDPRSAIDLYRLVADLKQADLSLPVLVRFNGILRDRVRTLVGAFSDAMAADGYEGSYTAVYPIKVNQQRSVVEQILHHGGDQVGLEAGSKPELMAVLALSRPGGVVICNGYKDREYIRLALIGQALGHRVFIVIEKSSEVDLVLEESRALGVAPLLGVRVRLASIGAGKWQNTGGEKSKFGLMAGQVLHMVERLREAGRLDALRLLHFHLGSQIANIRDIQRGTREAVRFYAELRRLGVPLDVVDVGGGLGVDYEGTRSRSYCSMNYNVSEYAHNIVHTLWELCTELELPHPDIVSESGRAMTAHHAVLLTNVIDVDKAPDNDLDGEPAEGDPLLLHDLRAALDDLPARPPLEVYHDAVHWLAESRAMYTHGVLTLEQRARAEQLYFAICRKVRSLLQHSVRSHREVMDELDEKLADKYFCNLSVFQSLPDIWGIEQVFPIMPLHRLDQAPTRRGVVEDLTCDSDGRVDHYVDSDGVDSTLPLHPVEKGGTYLLGFFMVGAYQEILGDMHNLFGDTDSVDVVTDGGGAWRLENARRGAMVDELLRYVHFEPDRLRAAYQEKVERLDLPAEKRRAYLEALASGMQGYTYFED